MNYLLSVIGIIHQYVIQIMLCKGSATLLRPDYLAESQA